MSNRERAYYAVIIGLPWWLWVLVYARNQTAPLVAEIRSFITDRSRR